MSIVAQNHVQHGYIHRHMNFNSLPRFNHQDENSSFGGAVKNSKIIHRLFNIAVFTREKKPWNDRIDGQVPGSQVFYKKFAVLEHLLQRPQGV